MHPYHDGYNLLYKAARDGWPLPKLQQLDPDFVVQEQEDDNPFENVVPPFIGDVPRPEFGNEYGELMVANLAKLRQELAMTKLSTDEAPGQLKGKAAKAAKKARAATTRAAHRKVQTEAEAAEAAVKEAKAAQKRRKRVISKQTEGEADEIAAQAAREKRNRRGPSARPASAATRR